MMNDTFDAAYSNPDDLPQHETPLPSSDTFMEVFCTSDLQSG